MTLDPHFDAFCVLCLIREENTVAKKTGPPSYRDIPI